MICEFRQTGDTSTCIHCGRTTTAAGRVLARCSNPTQRPIANSTGNSWTPPDDGPGKELAKLLAGLGIASLDDCQCKTRVVQMNAWGVDGCRARFNAIVGWLRDGQSQFGWADKLKAAALAAATGIAFKINPLDPFPGIVEEAIRRAEASQCCKNRASLQ